MKLVMPVNPESRSDAHDLAKAFDIIILHNFPSHPPSKIYFIEYPQRSAIGNTLKLAMARYERIGSLDSYTSQHKSCFNSIIIIIIVLR